MQLHDFPYLYSREGTFAHFTLVHRLPAILQGVVDQGWDDPAITRRLMAMAVRPEKLRIEPLMLTAEEEPLWQVFFSAHSGKTLDEIPFFFAEVYWFRYLLQVTGYHQNHIDPFREKKQAELAGMETAYAEMERAVAEGGLEVALGCALSGNKADLSQLQKQESDLQIVTNHTDQILQALHPDVTVHLLLDNAGTELFTDLLLAHTLLASGRCARLFLHIKALPIFVSDTISGDIRSLLFFMTHSGNDQLAELSGAIEQLLTEGKLRIQSDIFWNSPIHFGQLPENLKSVFGAEDVLISKGDANYRRFYEDREIPTYFSGACRITAHQFALRTLKSEIVAEVSEELADELTEKEPAWMSCGKYAVIQELK